MRLMDFFRKKNSRDIARDRLKLLLVSDRASCSPEIMEAIKNDMIQVISKYMVIDTEGMDIQITTADEEHKKMPVLFANIPIRDIKTTEK